MLFLSFLVSWLTPDLDLGRSSQLSPAHGPTVPFWLVPFGFLPADLYIQAVSLLNFSVLCVLVAIALTVRLGGPRAGDVFFSAMERLPFALAHSFGLAVVVLAGSVCFILPGIYLLLRLFPTPFVALFEPGEDVFSKSWRLTRGRFLSAFMALVSVLVLAVCILALAVAASSIVPASWAESDILAFGAMIGSFYSLVYVVPSILFFVLYAWFCKEDEDEAALAAEIHSDK